jgi:hypothetical protein
MGSPQFLVHDFGDAEPHYAEEPDSPIPLSLPPPNPPMHLPPKMKSGVGVSWNKFKKSLVGKFKRGDRAPPNLLHRLVPRQPDGRSDSRNISVWDKQTSPIVLPIVRPVRETRRKVMQPQGFSEGSSQGIDGVSFVSWRQWRQVSLRKIRYGSVVRCGSCGFLIRRQGRV